MTQEMAQFVSALIRENEQKSMRIQGLTREYQVHAETLRHQQQVGQQVIAEGVRQNSAMLEFRYVRIPLRIVPILYFAFCSRCFSIFGPLPHFSFENVPSSVPHSIITSTAKLILMI